MSKAVGLIQERIREDSCTPAQASKIRGVLGFLFKGLYGRVGRGGQQPLLQRQYSSDTQPWSLGHTLRRALEYLMDTMHVIQPRSVLLYKDPMPSLAIASDGRQDESSPPSIAALLFDPSSGQNIAIAAVIPPDLMKVWGDSGHCIALVEQAALILGIIRFRDTIRGRSLLWFEDLPDKQHADLQKGDKPPYALDMFSGANAPVAYSTPCHGADGMRDQFTGC